MKVVMFHPYVTEEMIDGVIDTLKSRWIGQGPKVDLFEEMFAKKFGVQYPVSVNSGTAALSLAYHLADIQPGDEVISPVFTCSATNIALLHQGAKIVWADIDPDTLNPSKLDIEQKITSKTKAIVNVHLSGNLNDLGKMPVPVIGDSCQAHLPPLPHEDYVCYSFQAIKHLTTGDGGMLVVNNEDDYQRAKKLRWFGIDREAKQAANWQVYKGRSITTDFDEAGWKYQMTDIAAALGIGALKSYNHIMEHHYKIAQIYYEGLRENSNVAIIGGTWGFPILVKDRDSFAKMLLSHGVETNVVQVRNDILSVFGGKRQDLPMMDLVEDDYIYLPLHMFVSEEDAYNICQLIRGGW